MKITQKVFLGARSSYILSFNIFFQHEKAKAQKPVNNDNNDDGHFETDWTWKENWLS